tara:strand:- start:4 stop:858 length:855 start_codon:yes stop_codon:yes gene_type:complete
MPINPALFPVVGPGDVVSATDIRNRLEDLERLVNGGITLADLKVSAEFTESERKIFGTRHIVRPEFYSVANTRVIGTPADVYYRNRFFSSLNRYVRHEITGSYQTGNSGVDSTVLDALPAEAWTPIDGMAASVVVKGEETVDAMVNGSLYAFGAGGSDGFFTSLEDRYNDTGDSVGFPNNEQRAAFNRAQQCGIFKAFFMLYVDLMDGNGPQPQRETERRIFNRGEATYPFRKTQVSFATKVQLSPGVNKISYRCLYRMRQDDNIGFNHVYIDNRNFFVDVHYK